MVIRVSTYEFYGDIHIETIASPQEEAQLTSQWQSLPHLVTVPSLSTYWDITMRPSQMLSSLFKESFLSPSNKIWVFPRDAILTTGFLCRKLLFHHPMNLIIRSKFELSLGVATYSTS